MIDDALVLIDFLKKHWTEYSVKSALFSADGTCSEGDDFIVVDKVSVQDNEKMWFYKVHEKPEYELAAEASAGKPPPFRILARQSFLKENLGG
ncbi:MAG: hypothetical protein A3H71_00735 [Candidatus Sungbacteria bacterium RIFCSPLOWO2_02_FULL_48_13b]|uniref:Uncharacterized protein n=1 Tax=Candidatus Sungbacteria bacterium RIFCSPLOWO2_02_FULL_48_13b TaxID=1802283 RepID=A0A1G2LFB0_9BACT|nr:MAG: hypothetical protein A3H71_00735 [Candidatus Sungbacteria bacterium RIFCSPLOWO2_02_FULL_48_13b]